MKTFAEPIIEVEKFMLLDVIATSDPTEPGEIKEDWELPELEFNT